MAYHLKLNQKAITNARESTKVLEKNTDKLQNELDAFKMIVEAKKKLKTENESFWQAGKSGSLINYAKSLNKRENIDMENIKKLRFLKHEERDIARDLENMKVAMDKEKAMIKKVMKETIKSKIKPSLKGPRCGQCEDKHATVSCSECVEDYCSSCFVRFHLKGALTKHRSRPIGVRR